MALQSEAPGGASPSQQPALSLVLTGRNDDYGAGFRTRFFRTLRFNDRELSSRGVAYELVFVEWAPPEAHPRLVDLVFDAIPELDPRQCRWLVVDPQYQEALSLNPRLVYLEFIAKNVGVRRAAGRFVLTSNCDVYLGRVVLDVIGRGDLKTGVVYRAARHDLAEAIGTGQPDWADLENPAHLDRPARPLRRPFMGGGTGDFLLLDRDSYHEMRGFNEVYRAARIGIDRNFIVKALSMGLPIEDIGGPVYHVNHAGSYRLSANDYAGRENEAPWGDRRWHSRGIVYVNAPDWGLAKAPTVAVAPCITYLDFSWDAVPLVADLKRIVIPASRLGGPAPGLYVSRS